MKAFAYVNPANEQEALAALKAGGIVRPIGGYGLPEWLRVSVGLPEENDRFINALRYALEEEAGQ